MSTIPASLTEKQFDEHIRPYISVAKRGYECQIPLYKVFNYILFRLHTVCQWHRIPIEDAPEHPRKKEISWHAIYYHFRKWSRDGSLERVWQSSIMTIAVDLNLSELNLDGSLPLPRKVVNLWPIKVVRKPRQPISCPSLMGKDSSSLQQD